MKLLIIDQCSNSKSYPGKSTVFDAAEIDEAGLETLCDRDNAVCLPARKLYGGRQQRYISEAVDSLRANGYTVDRYFISAGFGLISEDDQIPPYDVTFAEMSDSEIEKRSARLEISDTVAEICSSHIYDIIFLTLGNDYYRALDLPEIVSEIPDTTYCVVFNQEALAREYNSVISIPARTKEAKEQGTIVVALKGIYLKNFASHLVNRSKPNSADEITEYCMNEYTSQTDFGEFT